MTDHIANYISLVIPHFSVFSYQPEVMEMCEFDEMRIKYHTALD